MNVILKGILDEGEDPKGALENFTYLKGQAQLLEFDDYERQVFNYVDGFVERHGEVPALDHLREEFEEGTAYKDLLGRVEAARFLPGTYFKEYVRRTKENLHATQFAKICATGPLIVSGEAAIRQDGRKLSGLKDAVAYQVGELTKLQGELNEHELAFNPHVEAETFAERLAKSEPWGIKTGIDDQIDDATRGIKKGELYSVLGYSAHGKSTFCLNWAHNAFLAGKHVVYLAIEMGYAQVERTLITLHSCTKQMREVHPPIPYLSLRNYEAKVEETLSAYDFKFLEGVLLPDFASAVKINSGQLAPKSLRHAHTPSVVANPESGYGTIRVVTSVNVSNGFRLDEVSGQLAALHNQIPIDLLIVDYPNLMRSDSNRGDTRERLNSIIKGLKQLAETFAAGQGLAVVMPFQINRSGYERAKANNWFYDSTDIAETSEVMNSSDVVIYVVMDETMRDAGQMVVGCLKNRDGNSFPRIFVRANLAYKHLGHLPGVSVENDFQDAIADGDIGSLLADF